MPLNHNSFHHVFDTSVALFCMFALENEASFCWIAVTASFCQPFFGWFHTHTQTKTRFRKICIIDEYMNSFWFLFFILFSSFRHQCRRHCPQSTYEDWGRGVCLACPAPCTDCRSNTHCLTCQPGYFLNGTSAAKHNHFYVYFVTTDILKDSGDPFVLYSTSSVRV